MSTRTFERRRTHVIGLVSGAATALGLSAIAMACSDAGAAGADPAGAASASGASSRANVACALNGALSYDSTCTIEQVAIAGSSTVVIRHPNGSFRRFEVLAGGGLGEADGAQRAVVLRNGTKLEVTLGADRYRLEASQLGNAR